MELIVVACGTFLLCWLLDKGFIKAFRNKPQHQSGMSVRLNKHYGGVGTVLIVLGVAAVVLGSKEELLLWIGGAMLILLGICLIVYYMTFGIYYDDDSFVLTTFGRKSVTYRFAEIKAQQLYNSYGNILIELHMTDGRAVQLQANMKDVYPFLDKAFSGWLRQKNVRAEDCGFHDPDNSCWFPPVED